MRFPRPAGEDEGVVLHGAAPERAVLVGWLRDPRGEQRLIGLARAIGLPRDLADRRQAGR